MPISFWTTGPICILLLLPLSQPQECTHSISPKLFCHGHGTRLSPGSHIACCLVGETKVQTHTVIHHQVWGGPRALAEPITMPPGIWGGFLQVVTSELRFTGWVRIFLFLIQTKKQTKNNRKPTVTFPAHSTLLHAMLLWPSAHSLAFYPPGWLGTLHFWAMLMGHWQQRPQEWGGSKLPQQAKAGLVPK